VDFVLLALRGDRLVAAKGLQRHLGLEFGFLVAFI